MAQIFISVGSNQQPELYIRAARQALAQAYGELLVSRVFESEAVGFAGPVFLNLVIGAHTQESPQAVAQRLKTIELANGRKKNAEKFSNRTLDLDLLLYDDVISVKGVQIPRHEITENAFVLWPLAEVAPQHRHPVVGQTYQEMWDNYPHQQVLTPIPFDW
ncbi:2-amino-4-hydroxy-6-hydroxymethyldihydropteridine diphosphokinase [Neiella marina]|uniref:2-amino-4-hydroxy-6-hydroxymethyldihydropteridine diphosphokinase n=1 Tax=Neiella holothuriorum TaxID=2870530 RepID=A0ABS7EBH4_9GAMM|nr:2-amino-4-hydroxy-6-hydroxymethyldihydropteridine diphosphokinase [Neiella holothuriorum]MBW8189688.1 2-amino-4-hydroxy-6-hydroxymethyldihydropteridine diphosphokinase [Neiella holothuriorum]